MVLCYSVCQLILASRFQFDPCFILRIPWFLCRYFSSVFHSASHVRGWVYVDFLQYVTKESLHALRKQGGGGGSCRWWKCLHGCACGIILPHDLLRQSEAQYQVPVRLTVSQVTGEASSADHTVVQPRDRDFDPAIYPSKYVWKELLYYCIWHHRIYIYSYICHFLIFLYWERYNKLDYIVSHFFSKYEVLY